MVTRVNRLFKLLTVLMSSVAAPLSCSLPGGWLEPGLWQPGYPSSPQRYASRLVYGFKRLLAALSLCSLEHAACAHEIQAAGAYFLAWAAANDRIYLSTLPQ